MSLRSTNLKVLAVASGGGHWVQLRRLAPAFEGARVSYLTTEPGYAEEVERESADDPGPAPSFFVVRDASRWSKVGLLIQAAQVALALIRVRPDVVVTTGAAPGYFAILFGRLIGARTVWIDSVANADELSLSGAKAGRWAHLWLTQWPHLAEPRGPHFHGSVL